METSLSALAYKGSIPEAILESKKQKKLFVVYISGKDSDSVELEKSTWNDSKVADSLSKYCILLHIQEGSSDAANFSAIYPQKTVPSIAAIGYNGLQLWQKGFVNAEVLASSLEKAWLSLHMQDGERSTSTSLIDKLSSDDAEKSIPPTKDVHVINSPLALEPDKSLAADGVSSGIKEDKSLAQENIINQNLDFPEENSQLVTSKTDEALLDENDGYLDESHSDVVDNNKRIKTTSDAHLNIRLPDGVSLQEKFSLTSTLRMVKEYVDRNQASGIGSYDLAIPYPRKVFSNEDLGKSLSELGLHNRQALIVVPHQRASSYDRGNSSSDRTDRSYNDSSVVNSGGYFASIRRTLSYFNPLSYLGGNSSSSSSGQAQSGMWEYGPNSAARNNLASSSSERPFPSNSPNQSSSSPGRNDSRSRQRTSGFGSNIHTLKHDEDDSQFSDRNAFWNGNSTQYGGNNDSK
ncbi:plant UBX domain-containing protein 11 isoform X4 [Euphorbia lathyris]|uniref:plant UBX domain-containing protein 11 isoform X4 n=1 Tax=Euphorbia lathyris TaxID=212925 RepID=UPI003313D707